MRDVPKIDHELFQQQCPICNKAYFPAAKHAYKTFPKKTDSRYVCSYHCMRESERRYYEAQEIKLAKMREAKERRRQAKEMLKNAEKRTVAVT